MSAPTLIRQARGLTIGELPSVQQLLQEPGHSYLSELVKPENPEVDLVAVHGLNWKGSVGFAARTWAAGPEGEESLWLKDFLPRRLPSVRVLLYAYNSNVAFNTSAAGIGGHAEDLLRRLRLRRQAAPNRPLVFVCHSLGGILVKKAIVIARTDPQYSAINQSCNSFAFFATPHRGGALANYGKAVAGIVRRLRFDLRTDVMEALRKDSILASSIHTDFVKHRGHYRICSFYESRRMPGFPTMVVDHKSAVFDLGYPEEVLRLCPEADHSSICKFAEMNEDYEIMIDDIAELVEWAIRLPESRSSSRSPSQTSASNHPRNHSVTSRSFDDSSDEESASLGERSHLNPPVVDNNFLSTTSSFLGRIISPRMDRSKKEPIFDVPYTPNPSFTGREAIMHDLKKVMKLQQEVQTRVSLYGLGGAGKSQIALNYAFWHRLNYPERSVFWVHANTVDKLKQSLIDMAVKCDVPGLEGGQSGALLLLRNYLLDKTNGSWLIIVDNADNIDVFLKPPRLSKEHVAGGRPPEIAELAHYIPECSHGQLIFTTNSKSAAEILSGSIELVEVGPMGIGDARKLLRKTLATHGTTDTNNTHFGDSVPDEELESLAEYLGYLPLALTQAAAFIRQNAWTVKQYLEALDEDHSKAMDLLGSGYKGYEKVDDFSKAVASTWNITFDQIEATHLPAAELLSIMSFFDPRAIPKFLLQYFEADKWTPVTTCLKTLSGYSLLSQASDGPLGQTYDMHRLVQFAMRKRMHGSKSGKIWATKGLVALVEHFPNGKNASWKTCAALLPHALEIIKCDIFGNSEALLLSKLGSKVSQYYHELGMFREADVHSKLALQIENAPGATPEEILEVKYNRIYILQMIGSYGEAEQVAQEVLKERKKLLGANHIETLRSYLALGHMYQELGRFSEGEVIVRKCLKVLEKTTQPDEDIMWQVYQRLGTLLHEQGQYEEGARFLQKAISIIESKHGGHDLNLRLQKLKWRLAWIRESQGRYADAEAVTTEIYNAQKALLGPDHHETLKTQWVLATSLQGQHKFERALFILRELRRKSTRICGPEHTYTLMVASSLASCLVASTPPSSEPPATSPPTYLEAATILRDVLAHRAAHPLFPETLATATSLAHVLHLLHLDTEAEPMEIATLAKLKKSVGKTHPLTLKSRENLARILWAQGNASGKAGRGKMKEALEQAQKVLKGRTKMLGWAHVDTGKAAEAVLMMLPEGAKERGKLERELWVEKRREGYVRGSLDLSREGSLEVEEEKEWEKGDDESFMR